MTLRALIWAAVSTNEQTAEGKNSIPLQIENARALITKNDWIEVDCLIVDGHTRNVRSLHDLAQSAEKQGITAFTRLENWLARGGFDVIICRDANRFARKASLLHAIVEMVIEDCDARIYSLTDGWVDKRNYSMWAAMQGYKTSNEMRHFRELREAYIVRGIKDGIPPAGILPFTHRSVRNAKGKTIGAELNPDYLPMMYEVAEMFLEGLSLDKIAFELNKRGYHGSKGGKFQGATIYNVLYTPAVWGNLAHYHTSQKNSKQQLYGRWVFDRDTPPPDGVLVSYDVVPHLYDPDTERRMIAEMLRRSLMKGNRRPNQTYWMSGLVTCGYCQRNLNLFRHAVIEMRCITNLRNRKGQLETKCSAPRGCAYIKEPALEAGARSFLQILLDGQPIEAFAGQVNTSTETTSYTVYKNEVERLETELTALIRNQIKAPQEASTYYENEIRRVSERLTAVKTLVQQTDLAQRSVQREHEHRQQTIEEIRKMSIEGFFLLSDVEKNKLLHILLGGYRFVSLDGQIIGIANP